MESLTHTLTAVALSHAGLNRKTRFATLAMVAGANLPDVDWLTLLANSATALKYHRGFTHSLLGATILAALLAGIVYYLGRKASPKKSAPPLDVRWLMGICWIATLSHVLLDFTNSYGVRLFSPFSGRWYAWDIMHIVDPLLLALLILGMGLPVIFRLVSEEVGAKKPGFRRGAIFSLCALVALWGLRDLAHRRVVRLLDSHTYGQEEPLRVGAFPTPANPFQWTGVVETDSAFHVLSASALDDDVDAGRTRVHRKPETSDALQASERTRTGRIFLDFARFPWTEVIQTVEGFDATMRDLRFASPTSARRGFLVKIELDKELRARAESFSFTGDSNRSRD
ncbi:MAG: metal-dependent hydrolase [Acidobacteria bacterium]|nr:metal-dependent hydrolase [Acidobacteriota bacterium]